MEKIKPFLICLDRPDNLAALKEVYDLVARHPHSLCHFIGRRLRKWDLAVANVKSSPFSTSSLII